MHNIEQERHSWIKFAVIFAWIFIYVLISIVASDNSPEVNLNDVNMKGFLYASQVFGVVILFILPAVLFASLWTRARIHYLGITTKPAFSTLLLSGLGILLALPAINWLAHVNEQMHLPSALAGIDEWMRSNEARLSEMTEFLTKGTSVNSLLVNLFVVAFMAALGEELFFRGMLQKVLIECFKNKHVAIWIGAALFSAFHMQFFGFLPRMIMGAYLGYLFLWSGSLWPGMLAHFINNGMAVFLIWLSNRGLISADVDKTGMQNSQWIYVFTSVVLVSVTLVMVYRIEKRRKLVTIEGSN
ncbi:MAG TPA: CPBP family intramembrane glutamic endopeptidase [Bacteroidia bacterium]|jgi:hypothetical protein